MGIIIFSPKTIYTELLIKGLKPLSAVRYRLSATRLPLFALIKLRLRNFRLIHFQWLPTSSPFLFIGFLLLLKILRFKIIWTMHNIIPHEKRTFSKLLSILLFKWSDRVILASAHNLKDLKDQLGIGYNVKIRYIPIGELSDYFPQKSSFIEARKRLKIPFDKKVITYLGTIREYKGVMNFLRALKELHKKDVDIMGMVIGKPASQKLANEIEKFKKDLGDSLIINLNYILDSEIENYCLASDIFVLPYKQITNSLSIFLPYAFGRPVVSVAKGNILDVVQDGETGVLIGNSNPQELTAAIFKILKLDYKKMGEKGKIFTQRNFSWSEIGKMTVGLYKELIDATGEEITDCYLFYWQR